MGDFHNPNSNTKNEKEQEERGDSPKKRLNYYNERKLR